MAERLGVFRYRRAKYPWEEWETGVWRATYGEDFECDTATFARYLHSRARQIHRAVRTSQTGDTVTFEFFDKKEKA